uniref:XK-related protein n=1 Tax=Monodelphis domestica TaxID=13616 RepID=F6ZNJ3_MONDO
MAAKSDGRLKMKKSSDVAFTPLQNSDHSGSVQGLAPGLPEQQRYSLWDCLWILAAVAVYFADVGTDIWLAVDYYLRGQRWWFGLTLFFVVLGSLSVQVFSFRWFVHDFSTEDSSTGTSTTATATASSASGCPQPTADCKTVVSGGSAVGEGDARPSTPQRQASNASKSYTTTNSSNSSSATRTGSKNRSASCSFCIWLLQSLIHILQLGQIWRYCIRGGGKERGLLPILHHHPLMVLHCYSLW